MLRINSGSEPIRIENEPSTQLTPDNTLQKIPVAPISVEELEQAKGAAVARRNETEIEAATRKMQAHSDFLNTDDPLYGKQLADNTNEKVVVDAKTKKSKEPNVRKEQAKEAGKQVMGGLAPEGMDAGASIAEMGVEISASEIPGKAVTTMLSQIMIDPFVDGKTQNEASRLLDSFNKSAKSGNVAESLKWVQEHKQELEALLKKAKAQGYEPTVRL